MLVACTAAPVDPTEVPRDPAARGPWQVGVTTIAAHDPIDGQALTVEVWYPASVAEGADPEITLGIQLSSVRRAPADHRGGPFPLIGFSHGSGGLRVQSVYVTEHLASWGYVVVAPDHPRDTLNSSKDDRPRVLRARPHQVTAALDAALVAGGVLEGMIDDTRIGVIGHSFGAFTALVLAGARLDLPASSTVFSTRGSRPRLRSHRPGGSRSARRGCRSSPRRSSSKAEPPIHSRHRRPRSWPCSMRSPVPAASS